VTGTAVRRGALSRVPEGEGGRHRSAGTIGPPDAAGFSSLNGEGGGLREESYVYTFARKRAASIVQR